MVDGCVGLYVVFCGDGCGDYNGKHILTCLRKPQTKDYP